MTKWTDIHSGFTKELQKEWEDLNFNWLETQEWIKKGGLTPEDASFAYYLASTSHEPDEMKGEDLKELREDHRSNSFFQQKIRLEDWKNVHSDFTPKLIKDWRNFGFILQQTREWINIGMSVNDAGLCAWLESSKKVNTEWVLNFGDYQQLQNEYQQRFSNALIMAPSHNIKLN